MNVNPCTSIQSSFSAYLDGAVSGLEMQQISHHLDTCPGCAEDFATLRRTQDTLALLRPAQPPADLNLKLRLAISRERVRRDFRVADRVSLAWDNAVRPMLLQVSAGVAGTVLMVGSIMLLLGVFAAPAQAVLANDEPLGAVTAPHFLYSAVNPGAIVTGRDTAIIVEALIDGNGRVYDYKIVSGPEEAAVQSQVVNQLLLSVFKPASVFGVPVRGRVVLTYDGVSVHG